MKDNTKTREEIMSAMQFRYAAQSFDTTKTLSKEDEHTILESGRLAPSSFGIEAWKFIVVKNTALRTKMREASYGQPKVTDAPMLVVVARRTDVRENISQERILRTVKTLEQDAAAFDGLKQMIDGTIASKSDEQVDTWARAQTYLALGMMLETAALLGIDAGPMEGFDPKQIDSILGLKEKNLTATTLVAFGYRAADDGAAKRKKVRRDFADVVETME